MTVRSHSLTAQTAYHDLLSALLDQAASEIQGMPKRRELNNRAYWYDRFRVGGSMKERFLGEDSPELRQRIEQFLELKSRNAARDAERTRLVRLLRSERFLGADATTGSLLHALSRAGLFRLGGVLVGTYAFRQYEGELGLRLGLDDLAMTQDIDLASFERLSLALNDHVSEELATIFRDFDFEAVPGLDAAAVWRWRQTKGELSVEFLTPSFSEDEGIRSLAALGVSAQSLHHLNYLIADPIPAALVYRQGVLVRVPRPERYAVHKLIVAARRKNGPSSRKSLKDLRQAELLIDVLARDRPGELLEALEDARLRGPKWRNQIEKSLGRLPDTAQVLSSLQLN